MKHRLGGLAFLLFFAVAGCQGPPAVPPQPPPPPDFHGEWEAVLGRYTNDGKVDFASLEEFPKDLDAYLRRLEAVSRVQYEALPREHQIAFWINAHNAYAIDLVLRYWPIRTILEATPIVKQGTGGAFGMQFIPLGGLLGQSGRKLTLDDIARDILQAKFGEPRAWFAVARLCKSCPQLAARPYRGDTLSVQLDEAGARFFADRSKNRFDGDRRELVASSMLQWYSADFAPLGDALGLYEKYGPAADAAALRALERPPIVRYPTFDWSIAAK